MKHVSNWNSLSVLPTNTGTAPHDGNFPGSPAGMSFLPIDSNGGITYVDMSGTYQLYKAVKKCPPVASVVTSLSSAFVAGRVECITRSTGNYVRGENKGWERLMARPNPMQTGKVFMRQLYRTVKVNGWALAMKMYPAGFKDRPSQMWVLPMQCIKLERRSYGMVLPGSYSNIGDLYRILFCYNGEETELDFKDLMMFSDSTDIDPITLLPSSRLIELRYPVSNIIAIYEASATLIQKRGALGILSNHAKDVNGHIPVNKEERERVQNAFYSNYGLTRGQSQVIITTAALEWQQMAMNVKDLQLGETFLSNYKDVCEGFQFPFVLSSHSDQSTYTNSESGDIRLFQNTIMPDAEDLIQEQLNEGLNTAQWNVEIVMNYAHIPAMQAAAERKSKARESLNNALQKEWDAGLITRNMWLKALERDEVRPDDPRFDSFNKYKFELTAEEAAKIQQDGNNPPEDKGIA